MKNANFNRSVWGPLLLFSLFIFPRFFFAGEKPNVLLIMTDDQGYGDMGFHGNEKIDTPVMDGLAKQSLRFDRFFVCPYCTPTRAALMTGRYPLRTGAAAVTRGLETVRGEEVTIAEVLKTAGYATGCFGKWHIGEHYPSHPLGQGFDEYFGMPQGHFDHYFDPVLEHNGEMVANKGFITDVITDYALRFIEQQKDEPFFCYIPGRVSGESIPQSSAMVGSRSTWAAIGSTTMPASKCPGHRKNNGTRPPPSWAVPFMPRIPALYRLPSCPSAPLSDRKITMVRSASFH